MNDDEIVERLRSLGGALAPVELAEALDDLTGGGLSQSVMIMYFKRAFPIVPLKVLLDAGGWSRVSGGGLSDEQFNQLIGPWLRKTSEP